MPDSGHFDGSAFRGIDDDATRTGAPLSAALEGRMTNNAQWLHERGGGAPARVYLGGSAGTLASRSLVPHSTRTGHLMHVQPYLVTRGLTEVALLVQISVEDIDCELQAELDGVAGPLVRVTNTAGAEQQFIELTAPAPSSLTERLVALTVWCRALRDEIPEPHPTHGVIITANGVGVDFAGQQFTTNADRMVFLFTDEGITFDADAPGPFVETDPVYRLIDYPTNGDGKLYQGDELRTLTQHYFELPIAYVTLRSIQIEARYS